jgi:hypothetical protein
LSDAEIRRLEREVEASRAKLATDLSRLHSPAAYDDFAERARDVVVEQIKTRTRSAWQRVVDDMKAKAAENPAATLAIGAGLAWHIFRHPPIGTALVGAGLFSLLRTSSDRIRGSENYVSHAKQRLQQQATHLAGEVADRASSMATELKTEAGAMAEAVKEQSAQLAGAATGKAQEWATYVGEAVRDVPEQAASLARQAERSTHNLYDPDTRDNLLLGIAGVAVVAALGTAYQRRKDEIDAR